MDLSNVLMSLGGEATLLVQSSRELAADVHRAAKERSVKDSAYRYRKKPTAMASAHCPRTTPAQVLHELGTATTFFRQPAFADVARHWAHVRYCATLGSNRRGQLALSPDAEDVVHHHKVTQSEQLGIGLALVVAKEALRRQHPGWEFSAVDAEVALRAGFVDGLGPVRQTGRSKKRPDYFLVGRKMDGGGGFKVVVLECKGTHSDRSFALTQLATACVQVQSVEIGGSAPSGLMVASCLSRSGIVSYLLDPEGDDELWSGPDEQIDELLATPCEDLDLRTSTRTPEQDNAMAAESRDDPRGEQMATEVQEPEESDEESEVQSDGEPREQFDQTVGGESPDQLEPGGPQVFRIPAERRSWFFRVLARTAAANALLFAGDGEHAARYATARQRQLPGLQADGLLAAPGPEPVSTAHSSFVLTDGLVFRGTVYQAPLPGGRVLQVHRGVDEGLYRLLEEGQVGPYFRTAGQVRRRWLEARSRSRPDEVVSVGHDGTALWLRVTRG